jgi:hypothetical protein
MTRWLPLTLCFIASAFLQARADEPSAAIPVRPADSDAKLPEGFPGGTQPGVIEIKDYPAYRSAVAKGQNMTTRSGDSMFWALFRHISTHKVEMTAPVINTYLTDGMVDDAGTRGELTMEFLYPNTRMGETGVDNKVVSVVDHPPMTVVAIGVQGSMSEKTMRDKLAQLREWLAAHASEWKEAGPPRRLGYHGPSTPSAQRLWEVQIPIAPASANP